MSLIATYILRIYDYPLFPILRNEGLMDWCNTLEKNKKVFNGGITPFVVMCNIFIDYQRVRCGVIPLKVLHHFGRFGVILV